MREEYRAKIQCIQHSFQATASGQASPELQSYYDKDGNLIVQVWFGILVDFEGLNGVMDWSAMTILIELVAIAFVFSRAQKRIFF